MKFLVGSHNKLILWNGNSIDKTNGLDRYYGLTWDKEFIYSAARKEEVTEYIYKYDNNLAINSYFDSVKINFPHQIIYHNEKLYVANSGMERIEVISKNSHSFYSWSEHTTNWMHINSIWFSGNTMYVCEHRLGNTPSRISIINNFNFNEIDFIEINQHHYGLHNVYVENGIIYTLGYERILGFYLDSKKSVSLPDILEDAIKKGLSGCHSYLRGFARGPGYFLIGVSEIASRADRNSGDSMVLILDDNFNVKDFITFYNTGALYEIRIIDDLDLAHNGIKCPNIFE